MGSPQARIKMLDTLFEAEEYVLAAKRAGLYAGLMQWKAAQRRGEFAVWPTLFAPQGGVPSAPQFPPPPAITRAPPTTGQRTEIATIPPPKRALDVLHESYALLGLSDAQPLTHEMLRTAYRKAAALAHPDKGGNAERFDAVTRAFQYLQEVLDKLIPKTAAGNGNDARFTTPVTADEAMRYRGMMPTEPAPPGTPQIVDAPPIALNPKKLDMALFNKLFEENKLPDPDKDDGYGEWLKSQDGHASNTNAASLRTKYNKDMFNKMFEQDAQARGSSSAALTKYAPPSELVMAPNLGTELGGGRPAQYTQVTGSKGIGYTDLKYAYDEGSTFSQQVANVSLEGRPKTLEQAKMEYGAAPKPLSAEEAAAVAAFERARELAEQQRRQRVAARDVDAEAAERRLKGRLMIQ